MSLIRPEMRALLIRYAEPAAYGLVALLAALWVWRAFALRGWVAGLLGLAVLAVAGIAALAWHRRNRFRVAAEGAGIVEVDEQRVAYWAPESGGFVDLDALTRLEIDTGPGGPVWILRHEAGPPLRIPLEARGAAALADTFAALPGARLDTAAAARDTQANARFLIWKRQGA